MTVASQEVGENAALGWLAPLLACDEVTPERYSVLAPATHRRRLGQYFTPPRIATWMANWALWPGARTVLDPAVGTGILLSTALSCPHPSLLYATGIDVDPAILQVCQQNLRNIDQAVTLHQADFLTEVHTQRYDAILCNPPYIRHRAIPDRETLYTSFDQELGLTLNRFSNSYVLFILRIARLLTAQGRAAIITPVDYLNANFGTPIKAFLLRENLLDGLVLFERSQLVFDNANIAACILLLRAAREPHAPIRFTHVVNEQELPLSHEAAQPPCIEHFPATLHADAKWLELFPREIAAPTVVSQPNVVPLKQLAAVRRGIATGSNAFFTLTASQCREYGIETHEYRRCVTKASHASRLIFTPADYSQLCEDGEKVYLLDVGLDASDAARRYLAEGVRNGVDTRYLTKHRRLWYATEPRPAAPLWVNTFSRRQFRFVVNDAGVANLTAFHAIYPHVEDREYWLLLAALLNTSLVARRLQQQLRVYGSGLQKLEPLDVATLAVSDPERIPASRRAEIIELYKRRCAFERTDKALAMEAAEQIERLLTD